MAKSQYLDSLQPEEVQELRTRLHKVFTGNCYICQDAIDLEHHKDHVEIDHVIPLAQDGDDAENNFCLAHASCNRTKAASDLRVARCLLELDRLEKAAKMDGERGANLGDVLRSRKGSQAELFIQEDGNSVRFSFPAIGRNEIYETPVFNDTMSGLAYFFTTIPIEYLHHDDIINPRPIGSSVRGLIEEFLRKRPQLHVGLAWWEPGNDGKAAVKLFDGQHKAAAQILLGVKELPVRVFLRPDIEVLRQANTNAGSTLKQVAFDKATLRHLGSSLYNDRIEQYRSMQQLAEDDYSFSEQALVNHFRGERRQMERYIIDAQRDAITRNPENKLIEFVEWAGKGTDKPMSYATLDSSFFQLLHQKALDTPIDLGTEREIERRQMVQLMNLFAEVFLISKWDQDVGGRRLETRIQSGHQIPDEHLKAWRVCRSEITVNITRQIQLIIEHHNATQLKIVDRDRLFLEEFPAPLWENIANFFKNLSKLPCWINTQLSSSVFGAKQNNIYWDSVFKTGKSPSGTFVMATGLDLTSMMAQS